MFRRILRRLRVIRFRLKVFSARKALPGALIRNFAVFYLLLVLVAAGIVGFTLYPGTFERLGSQSAALLRKIARGGHQAAPLIIDWVQPGLEGPEVLEEAMPHLETGPEPLSEGSIVSMVRRMIEFVTGYDFADPRSFFIVEAGGRHVDDPSRLLALDFPRIVHSAAVDNVPVPSGTDLGEAGSGPPAAQPSPASTSDTRESLPARPPGPDHPREEPPPGDKPARAPTEPSVSVPKRVDWGENPLVLIFHHHAGEDYGGPGDSHAWNHYSPGEGPVPGVVQVGERLAKTLREQFGVPVLHIDRAFDYPVHSRAYLEAEKSIAEIIEQNPQIRMVIDIHRDEGSAAAVLKSQSVSSRTPMGQSIAQVSAVVAAGGVELLPHPNWRKNYQFALLLLSKTEQRFPELLARRDVILAHNRRYNQHLHPHAVILEVGGHEDSLEEALRTADLLAEVIVEVLDEMF